MPVSTYGNNFYIFILILAIFTLIFTLAGFYFTFNFIKIMFFWIVSLQRDTLWIYKELLWNNRTIIFRSIPVISVLLIVYVLNKIMDIPWQSIALGLFMIIIGIFVKDYNKIVSAIQSSFEKHFKQ